MVKKIYGSDFANFPFLASPHKILFHKIFKGTYRMMYHKDKSIKLPNLFLGYIFDIYDYF